MPSEIPTTILTYSCPIPVVDPITLHVIRQASPGSINTLHQPPAILPFLSCSLSLVSISPNHHDARGHFLPRQILVPGRSTISTRPNHRRILTIPAPTPNKPLLNITRRAADTRDSQTELDIFGLLSARS